MENGMVVNVTPLQALLTVAFQIWLIVFPIILIRKLNYVITILKEQFYSDNESAS